jgi:uncharacterized protein (TIGR03435 family)
MRFAIFALSSVAAFGQTFEVASVRPVSSDVRREAPALGRGGAIPLKTLLSAISGPESVNVAPGSLMMRSASLASVIQWAYAVEDFQLSGPGWLRSIRFDIIAKAAGPASAPEMRIMLQALLADRFHLEFHRQSRELGTYVLSVAKTGHKLKLATEKAPGTLQQTGTAIAVKNVGVADMLTLLSQVLRAPVVDQTGLTGEYDFKLDIMTYAADMMTNQKPGDAPPDPVALVTTLLREQFGLKLDGRKVPVDVLVIDKVDKIPTEN